MIRIACCDDNDLQRELLVDILNEYGREHMLDLCVESFASGREMLVRHKDGARYDIYVMDVLMPDMNGLETASVLRNRQDNGALIYLSATGEYAVSSYDVDASYYLLKPIDRDKLFRVLDRTIKRLSTEEPEYRFHSREGDVSLPMSQIMYVTLENRCARIVLADGRKYLSPVLRSSFRNEIAPLLDNRGFCFSSASTLVNLSFVEALDELDVIMKDNEILPVSRAMYPELKYAWKQHTLR